MVEVSELARTKLHSFFRSSTSHRVRIALNLKKVEYRYVAYRLRSGEHRADGYRSLNPQMLVPALELANGTILTQSLAIIEYIDETIPLPPLLPATPSGRARVRSIAQMIALDIHPLNNLRVLNALRSQFGANETVVAHWFQHWVQEAFVALEERLAGDAETGRFCHQDTPTLADICLAAQVASNARFSIDHTPFPTIMRISKACEELAPFRDAQPSAQPDAE